MHTEELIETGSFPVRPLLTGSQHFEAVCFCDLKMAKDCLTYFESVSREAHQFADEP